MTLARALLLLLSCLSFWAGAQVPGVTFEEQALQVMTYNIRLNTASDGENAWPNRRDFLASQIAYHLPDVIGTQEGLPEQIDWLNEHLPTYNYVGQGRDGADQGEYSAIFYNRHKLSVIRSGTFWLSETPGKISRGWDAALNRICTWARFSPRGNEQEFMVFNTHFDHVGQTARANSVDLILTMIDSLNQDGLPFVLTGDFNLEPDAVPLQKLRAALTDTYDAAAVNLGPTGTFTGFQHDKPATRRIDYVFTSRTPKTVVTRYAVLTDAVAGRYPSDHFPVVATLHLRPRPVVVAHRGASGYALKNTLDAFRRAVDLKADMVELDVFTLKDGRVVCFHDDELERLTGVQGRITDYTLAELNQLTLSDGSRIPLLSEALKVMDKQLRVNVELKGPGTAVPTYLVIQEAIRSNGWKLEDFHISSFKHDQLKIMRSLDADIEIGILPNGMPLTVLELARELDAFSINANRLTLNSGSVRKMHEAGLKVYAWTVNKPGDIRLMLELGVDGIITNYPDRVRLLNEE